MRASFSMKEDKRLLRERTFEKIDGLSEDYIRESDGRIFGYVTELREFKEAENIFVYYSTGREPDTIKLIELSLKLGKAVYVPRIVSKGIMEAARLRTLSSAVNGKFRIPTAPEGAEVLPPHMIDLAVVPAVAFDKEGYRLGYGGGYYDRFLGGLRACTVGLARGRILMERVPREAHDISVDYVVTEDGVLKISKARI